MGRYRFGQIIGAFVSDGKGNTKDRPVVIISDDDEVFHTGEILVIPITKSQSTPCPNYHIQVHTDNIRDPYTGLHYPCWAKCDWARWIESTKVTGHWGYLPDELLTRIVTTYDALYDDLEFEDWQ
jgi:mRNA-degrading endonuclease toxin of MazEF toxin-antitoxin module